MTPQHYHLVVRGKDKGFGKKKGKEGGEFFQVEIFRCKHWESERKIGGGVITAITGLVWEKRKEGDGIIVFQT